MQSDTPRQLVESILGRPLSERPSAIRELRSLDRSLAVHTIELLLNESLDENSTTTAIKMLGSVGSMESVNTLLRFYETHRTAVTSALVRVGVFDEFLPRESRERKMVRRALNHAKPELLDIIREGRLTRESLRSVLPTIM